MTSKPTWITTPFQWFLRSPLDECQIFITVDRERCGEVVIEFTPLHWEGELPGWKVRWRLTTEDAWHLHTLIETVYLPVCRNQPNVIANFQISPWNEFVMFLAEYECVELLKMLDEAIRVARPSTLWTPE